MKILSKQRVRSEKGSGKQAKRWRTAGMERAPANALPVKKARQGEKSKVGRQGPKAASRRAPP